MPKISYLAKAKNGKDDTEVTALQIEQKIADIEALLRGMIDEDNMLCADDGKKIVPLSPSNVVDMPIETRPVQQCMKFFGITREQDTGIVEKLFDEIHEQFNGKEKYYILGGLGENEIIMSGLEDTTYANPLGTVYKDLEIPVNMAPVTCSDLWDFVKTKTTYLNVDLDSPVNDTWLPAEKSVTTLAEFSDLIGVSPANYVFEFNFEAPLGVSRAELGRPVVDLDRNVVTTALSVKNSKSEFLCRYSAGTLFRVNP